MSTESISITGNEMSNEAIELMEMIEALMGPPCANALSLTDGVYGAFVDPDNNLGGQGESFESLMEAGQQWLDNLDGPVTIPESQARALVEAALDFVKRVDSEFGDTEECQPNHEALKAWALHGGDIGDVDEMAKRVAAEFRRFSSLIAG